MFYVLCIEEIQKTYLLFRILIEKETNKVFTKEEKDYYSKFFSRHTLKIKAAGIQGSSYNDFAERHSLIKKNLMTLIMRFLIPNKKIY